jgi:hypothetical protein
VAPPAYKTIRENFQVQHGVIATHQGPPDCHAGDAVLIAPVYGQIPTGDFIGKIAIYGFQSQSSVKKALCRSGFCQTT